MVDFNRQETGRRGGQERQRRLRIERAQHTAKDILEEMFRLGLLNDSTRVEDLPRIAAVIVPILQDAVKPASSRKRKEV